MKKITLLIILLLALTDVDSSAAFDTKGFQPVQPYGTFSTLSAYTIEKDKPGIMFSLERSIEPNFYRLFINASYGLTDKIEILTSIPFIFNYRGTGGIGDTSIGYKYNILSEKRLGPSISYLFGFSIPGKETFSTLGHVGGALLISKRVGPFRGHGNLFYFKSTSSSMEDEVELRLGLDLAAAHSFNILSELIVKKSHFSDHIDLVEGKMGYRVKISSNSYAALGVGYDFKNRTPELRIFLTLSLFPLDQVKVKRIYYKEGKT
ncbi:hypothetical protein MNBD_NITROSPIRAE02-1123 [hydrothermal vent metagenome]|uniref:Uncharacterized protein n=1 Tax=hydrothermal vent metagenome TaxID=652676 RepID=A0A3B1CV88_9ZZZZ